ncbi:alpha/beta fold hydrolase [Candidimonas nitroreducens]|uniref:Alpha/beta hydrolase n=1 Tax=Candidimonas nitroreducens TaxID=683354 RepID=A0A225M0B9_9BURK|nr:alpha/beta hydrolase [Candidimonas nitroreducens]OWT54847.1 alpha/beta hydrolase [Candidimonas nitroreducens]
MQSLYMDGGHFRVNGIRQHYLRCKAPGLPVVIVPGIVSPAALWLHVAEALAGDGYDVWIVDVRGRGLSEQGPHMDYGLDACTDDLQAFLPAAGLSQPLVVGHSMGARIGARLAARSSAIGALVMLDPPASAPGGRPYPIPAERTANLLQAARRGEAEAYLRRPGVAQWPEPLLRQRAQWLASCDPRVIEPAYRDFHEQDVYEDVARASCPVTLVAATASGVINEAEMARFQRVQPALAVVRAEGAAHQLQAENTDLCLRILRQILPKGVRHTS